MLNIHCIAAGGGDVFLRKFEKGGILAKNYSLHSSTQDLLYFSLLRRGKKISPGGKKETSYAIFYKIPKKPAHSLSPPPTLSKPFP